MSPAHDAIAVKGPKKAYNGPMTFLLILIPLGLLATLAVLLTGVYTMGKGGIDMRRRSNKLMQMRVLLQFATVLVIFLIVVSAASG